MMGLPTVRAAVDEARDHGEDGQIMILSIAYALLALLLLGVVVSASSIHLERKRLLTLADTSALAGASALDVATYFADPAPPEQPLRITDRSVRAAVLEHLAESPGAARLTEVTVVRARSIEGRTAEVTLRARAHPAILSWVTAPWSDGIVLEATARSRTG